MVRVCMRVRVRVCVCMCVWHLESHNDSRRETDVNAKFISHYCPLFDDAALAAASRDSATDLQGWGNLGQHDDEYRMCKLVPVRPSEI